MVRKASGKEEEEYWLIAPDGPPLWKIKEVCFAGFPSLECLKLCYGNIISVIHTLVMKENEPLVPFLLAFLKTQHFGLCAPRLWCFHFFAVSTWLIFRRTLASTYGVKSFTGCPSDFIPKSWCTLRKNGTVGVLSWRDCNTEASLIKTQTMDSLSHSQPCPMERLSSAH